MVAGSGVIVPARRWRARLLGLLVVALGAILPGGPAAAAALADEAPGFETVPCWSPAAAPIGLRCGYLTMPESRERPNGRTIRIAVAILTPRDAPPATMPAPLVHLAGGPGSAVGLSGPAFELWLRWYADWPGSRARTLILVDQRGTGRSEPQLYCDPVVSAWALRVRLGAALPRDPAARAAWFRDHLMACRAPFDAAGIDVAAYNTAENAADFVALRQALGIAQWDVWGVSYGAELALELLRIDEAATRSLILDSVSLYRHPEVVVGNAAAAFDRALTQVVRECLLDAPCREIYPGLSTGFNLGLRWLDLRPERIVLPADSPWPGETIVIDGRHGVELMLRSMYVAAFIPFVPATMSTLAVDRKEPLTTLASHMATIDAMLPRAELVQTSTDCRAAPWGDALRRLDDEEGRYPNYAVLWSADFHATVCAAWGSPPADPAELSPVRSDVPALILNGRYDPVTPPAWGRIVAEWLPNSTAVEFPHLSHGSLMLDGCADEIAAAFLDQPGQDPRQLCFAELRPAQFVLPEFAIEN